MYRETQSKRHIIFGKKAVKFGYHATNPSRSENKETRRPWNQPNHANHGDAAGIELATSHQPELGTRGKILWTYYINMYRVPRKGDDSGHEWVNVFYAFWIFDFFKQITYLLIMFFIHIRVSYFNFFKFFFLILQNLNRYLPNYLKIFSCRNTAEKQAKIIWKTIL